MAGETAGHVHPALPVAGPCCRAQDGVDVLFLGMPRTVAAVVQRIVAGCGQVMRGRW